jgi:hypothetical protein
MAEHGRAWQSMAEHYFPERDLEREEEEEEAERLRERRMRPFISVSGLSSLSLDTYEHRTLQVNM